MKTASLAGSVTAATALAPTPSMTRATAPSRTASRAMATGGLGGSAVVAHLRSAPCRRARLAANRAPRSRNCPIHGCAVSGAETTTSAPLSSAVPWQAGDQEQQREQDPHAAQPGDPVGHGLDQAEVVLHQQHRLPLGRQSAEDLTQHDALRGGHAGGRLVEQQHVGTGGDRTGDLQQPLVADAEPLRVGAGDVGEPEVAQGARARSARAGRRGTTGWRAGAGGPPVRLAAAHRPRPGRRRASRGMRTVCCGVRTTPVRTRASTVALGHLAVHLDGAGVDVTGEDLQQGRLAAAVGADQPVHLTGPQLEVDVVAAPWTAPNETVTPLARSSTSPGTAGGWGLAGGRLVPVPDRARRAAARPGPRRARTASRSSAVSTPTRPLDVERRLPARPGIGDLGDAAAGPRSRRPVPTSGRCRRRRTATNSCSDTSGLTSDGRHQAEQHGAACARERAEGGRHARGRCAAAQATGTPSEQRQLRSLAQRGQVERRPGRARPGPGRPALQRRAARRSTTCTQGSRTRSRPRAGFTRCAGVGRSSPSAPPLSRGIGRQHPVDQPGQRPGRQGQVGARQPGGAEGHQVAGHGGQQHAGTDGDAGAASPDRRDRAGRCRSRRSP